MKSYYHATVNSHPSGVAIYVPPGGSSFAYTSASKRGLQWVEDKLDELRPAGAPRRQVAVFASGTPQNAALFAQAQNPGALINVYEVTLDVFQPSPMVIVGHIGKKGACSQHVAALVKEYWEPSMRWEFLEYLTNKMTVRQKIPLPCGMDLISAHVGYTNDCQQVEHTWP